MTPSITRRRFAALSSLLCTWPTLGFAQGAYPSRPVKLIIPWPPGGGVNVFGRAFQVRLGELLGQPIIIENIGGGSGRIGTIAAARGAPDGYTILLANDTFAALEALQAPGSAPLRAQFAPVTLTVSAPQGVFTHPKSGIRTIQEYVQVARKNPGKLNVGVPGLGSSQHLTSELLLRAAGDARVTHIAYRGGGPLLQDLLGGTLDAGVVTFSAGAQHARAGQLVPLAVTSGQRTPTFPEVPTAAQTVAPGFVQTTWMGLFVPRDTPPPIQARIHEAAFAALKDSAVVERLRTLGFDAVGQDGAALARLFDQTTATFASIAAERRIALAD